ncbi:DUF357 domain-containing protein [Candidatus Pacearchaeota archaeon]|nr:hypothetical protein [uncultured archaeon]MBS3084542.1 DUF357 domain-containing protein [Candidatus Pacearchaeota archaeon]
MEKEITEEKLDNYFKISETAFKLIKNKIAKGKEKKAKEIIEMVENYLSDAHYFKNEENFVNAFAALNYAHGWIDSGVRLRIFDVHDNKLFTIR